MGGDGERRSGSAFLCKREAIHDAWYMCTSAALYNISHFIIKQVRQASRDAALREVKERAKKAKAEKGQAGKGAQSKAPVAKTVPKGKGR